MNMSNRYVSDHLPNTSVHLPITFVHLPITFVPIKNCGIAMSMVFWKLSKQSTQQLTDHQNSMGPKCKHLQFKKSPILWSMNQSKAISRKNYLHIHFYQSVLQSWYQKFNLCEFRNQCLKIGAVLKFTNYVSITQKVNAYCTGCPSKNLTLIVPPFLGLCKRYANYVCIYLKSIVN